MQSPPVQIVFTDLDGTLLDTRQTVSKENLDCLNMLGERKIVRVIATGRSHYSFAQVIQESFPTDYLIFSSGVGIIDLREDHLLNCNNLSEEDTTRITEVLLREKIDFMVHSQAPENHYFVYHRCNEANDDFNRRVSIYHDFATAHNESVPFPASAAQVIAVLDNDDGPFNQLKSALKGYQVTRTTSPLDHSSIWMEIQPKNVHKGSAAAWICDHLGIAPSCAVGIGNDYNDIDLLDFTPRSYLLKNAPAELHNRYRLGPSNNKHGFSKAIEHALAA